MSLKPYFDAVLAGENLSQKDAEAAFNIIMSGQSNDIMISAFLVAMHQKGETIEEVTGAAKVMRAKALPISAPADAIDTCGTGGDGMGTLNISTAAALVLAGCDVPVAKHGNRNLSSKSGSAQVLQALGVNIDADVSVIEKSVEEANVGFMMAPRHHGAMKHVGPVRVELGIRTIFNLLGPLANPAGTKRQLIGVFDEAWVRPLANVLINLGAEKAWVVHGSDGLDEITTTGKTFAAEYANGELRSFKIDPENLGIALADPADLAGGEPEFNAEAIQKLLIGEASAYRDIVALNAAAGLVVADKVEELKDGLVIAYEAIASGAAKAALAKMVEISNG